MKKGEKGFDQKRCCVRVAREFFQGGQCLRLMKVKRKGKGYCAQHDPDQQRKRDDIRRKRLEARSARSEARSNLEELRDQLAIAAVAYVESYHAPARRAALVRLAPKYRAAETQVAITIKAYEEARAECDRLGIR